MTPSSLTIKQICSLIPAEIDAEYDYVGVRVVAPWYNDYDAWEGETLDPSWRWEDGEQTEDRLNGACSLDLEQLRGLVNPPDTISYTGNRLLIIGGNVAEWGEDSYEIIIHNAEVMMIIDARELNGDHDVTGRA